MDNQTTINLLPQIIEKKLERGLAGSKISFKDIEISFGKTVDDLSEEISQKLNSVSNERAGALWNALDEDSKHSLVYADFGTFNLGLIEKLNLNGGTLCEAFISKHAKFIFQLNTVPLFSRYYGAAFTTLQAELLATCKQLLAANNKQCLFEFLESFDVEFLASMVRHEMARYYVDENEAQWPHEIDIVETENGVSIIEDEEPRDEQEEFDKGSDDLYAFENAFINGDTVSHSLQLTYWLQYNAPTIFSTIRNLLTFFSRERGVPIWERPNPVKNEKETDLELLDNQQDQYSDSELGIAPGNEDSEAGFLDVSLLTALEDSAGVNEKQGIVSVRAEKEFRRLIRLYCITTPLKKNYVEIDNQSLEGQGEVIARILKQSGKDTTAIQTFDDLRQALWDVIGFSAIVSWVNRQESPDRLIDSSGKRELFNQMKYLEATVFTGRHSILLASLKDTKEQVSKLYGWLSLVKIFWSITSKQRRFINLASVIDDVIVWEEGITVCTLIFQAVLNTEKLFFSLDDVALFCEKSRERKWSETMKELFRVVAEENNALSAAPIFEYHIDHLEDRATNIFHVADFVKLASNAELAVVVKVREAAEDYKQRFVDERSKNLEAEKPEEKPEDKLGFLYSMAIAQINGIGKHKKEANRYFDSLILKITRPHSFEEVWKKIKSKG